jgi:hypothetical protein
VHVFGIGDLGVKVHVCGLKEPLKVVTNEKGEAVGEVLTIIC